jgi:hypothetical protein
MVTAGRDRALVVAVAALLAPAFGGAGCADRLDVGSDVLWTARYEVNGFEEWTGVSGIVGAEPATSSLVISEERVHRGRYAAKMTIDGTPDPGRHSAAMSRPAGLPSEAYYSAWYYLPHTVDVRTFWVIAKFRMRGVADDPTTDGELYDLNLATLPSGEMSLRLYDHRSGDVPLIGPPPVVPTGRWFQVEAFYRNAQDGTGHVTYWLDGKPFVDVAGPMAPTPWVGWYVCSIGEDLDPVTAVLYADDVAVSRTRVGPHGLLEYQ